MLTYITLGGLSAAIYNEVLQFFVIVAALLPLTLIGLHRVGGVGRAESTRSPAAGQRASMLSSWPGDRPDAASTSPFWSVIGIVFGLGFVLSFGYWTTNFVEVQRAMASQLDLGGAQRPRSSASFPKMFVPFIVIIPGMIAAVLVPEVDRRRKAVRRHPDVRLQRLDPAT